MLVAVLLFVLLSPGFFITLSSKPLSKGTVSIEAILLHAALFALSLYTIKQLGPKGYQREHFADTGGIVGNIVIGVGIFTVLLFIFAVLFFK